MVIMKQICIIIIIFASLFNINCLAGDTVKNSIQTKPKSKTVKIAEQNNPKDSSQNKKNKEDYVNIWKNAIESTSPIYESTNKSITQFGILITVIVSLFSILLGGLVLYNDHSLKTATQKQFEEFKNTLKREELLSEIQKSIPDQINETVKTTIAQKFDNEYRDKIYVWTQDQVENIMGWSLKHSEIMLSYQRKQAQNITKLLLSKFEDSAFSNQVYEIIVNNAQDTLTMYKILSGDVETLKSGLLDFTAHPIEVFRDQLMEVKIRYKNRADVQEYLVKAENALLNLDLKKEGKNIRKTR